MINLSDRSREVCAAAVLIALTVGATTVLRLPAFGSKLYFHFGEAVILVSALLGGRRLGAWVGGVGAAAADVILGLLVWAPVSFAIHGIEGYIVGSLSDGKGGRRDAKALGYGAFFMVAAYALAAAFIYGKAAVPVQITGDVAQASVGVLVAWFVASAVRRACPALILRRDRGRGAS